MHRRPPRLDTLSVIVEIAVRNLVVSRGKTAIVAGITGFGALLIVLGLSLLDSIDQAMRRTITSSIAGHIQVYSADAKDVLEIFGSFYVNVPDIGSLPDFARVRRTLSSVPNVAAVVPMGFSNAVANSDNAIDRALAELRSSMEARAGGALPERQRAYQTSKARVRDIVAVLRRELDQAQKISQAPTASEERTAVERAAASEFWADFDANAAANVEFIDTRVARVAAEEDPLFLRYVGTDPAVFARTFQRMRIVDGQLIPEGRRGFLFSKLVYEKHVKLKAARGLDYIRSAREDREAKIALDPELQRVVSENINGIDELLLQLDAAKTASLRRKLGAFLSSNESDVGMLLAAFFATDDSNFDRRYAFFYAELAPELQLYRFGVGDTLTLKTITRAGTVTTANVKVYGTFVFEGLEKSPQANAINILDLITFRELYGFSTREHDEEIAHMRAEAGAVDLTRQNAEAALFGARTELEEQTPAAANQPQDGALQALRGTQARFRSSRDTGYDPKQLEEGSVLNAAVVVADDTRIDETMRAIERASQRAGLRLKVVSWQTAAGLFGQFATLMRFILYVAVLIIFVVALVVISNALVMATLDRVHEIGTLRAIGAQPSFILAMLIVESGVVGLLAGGLGVSIAELLLTLLHGTGIPAWTDTLTFYFSGPRLFPTLDLRHGAFALSTIVSVSLVSGAYPAWLAMRVSPREAMHAED